MSSAVEPLRLATDAEILALVEIYRQYLPKTVAVLYLLENSPKWRAHVCELPADIVSDRLRRSIYVPSAGDLQRNGTFIIITGDEDTYIVMATLEQEPEELGSCVSFTKHIKWGPSPLFVTIDDKVLSVIERAMMEKNLIPDTLSDCLCYWMDMKQAELLPCPIANDVELRGLDMSYAEMVNDMWPYRYKNSLRYFECLIRFNGAYGLFEKASGKLLGWVMKNDHDSIGHLHILEGYESRGYGTTLASAMARRIATEDRQHVHLFIGKENVRSRKLFEKLGFKFSNEIQWTRCNPV